jgi:aspartate 1-decarboxylase
MNIKVLKSKIHNAVVTDHNLDYDGSIGIDADLIKAAHLSVYEKVHLLNIDNGQRLETYVIEAESGSKKICIYGAAAHLIQTGQRIIILSYASIDENETNNYKPKVVHLDKNNTILD